MATFDFAFLSLTSLLIMINPISILPSFVSMTSDHSVPHMRRFALRSTLAALVVLLVFAVIGKLIFAFFSISLESLRIVGGILFFAVGYEMLHGRTREDRHHIDTNSETVHDQSIAPMGIPLICGPGAISTVMLLMNQCSTMSHKFLLVGAIVVVTAVTFLTLLLSRRMTRFLGRTGLDVLLRITGLLVMAIAVEFFIGGIMPIAQRLLGN